MNRILYVLFVLSLFLLCGCWEEREQLPAPVVENLKDKVKSPEKVSPKEVAERQPEQKEAEENKPVKEEKNKKPEQESKKTETAGVLLKGAFTEKDKEKKKGILKKIIQKYHNTEEFYEASEVLAFIYAEEGERFKALEVLSGAYLKSQDGSKRKEWAKKMEEWNRKVFFSFYETPISRVYVVQPGDTLSAIGSRFNIPYKFIMRINSIKDPRRLNIGDRIKIPVPQNEEKMEAFLQIDRSEYSLSVFINGMFLKRYPIGLGKEDRTPTGDFTIIDKVHKPSWRGKPYGHPENIIGDWWLGFDETNVRGLGIHGTNDPSSIGKDVSQGCIRMLNRDVDELANTVPKGTKVTVRD